MSSVLIKPRWTRQPQGANATIDWGNPITRDICFAWTPVVGHSDAVTGKLGSPKTSNPSRVGSPHGQAVTPVLETSGGITWGTRNPFKTGNHSFLTIAAPRTSGTQAKTFVGTRGSSSNFGLCLFWANYDGSTDSVSSGKISLNNYDTTRESSFSTTNAVITSGKWSVFSASHGPTVDVGQIYVDGVSVAVSVWASGVYANMETSTTAELMVGNIGGYTGGSTYVHDDPILLCVAWNRHLPAAEHYELYRNPWQIFAPLKRRIYYDSAAAATGATTTALLSAGVGAMGSGITKAILPAGVGDMG